MFLATATTTPEHAPRAMDQIQVPVGDGVEARRKQRLSPAPPCSCVAGLPCADRRRGRAPGTNQVISVSPYAARPLAASPSTGREDAGDRSAHERLGGQQRRLHQCAERAGEMPARVRRCRERRDRTGGRAEPASTRRGFAAPQLDRVLHAERSAFLRKVASTSGERSRIRRRRSPPRARGLRIRAHPSPRTDRARASPRGPRGGRTATRARRSAVDAPPSAAPRAAGPRSAPRDPHSPSVRSSPTGSSVGLFPKPRLRRLPHGARSRRMRPLRGRHRRCHSLRITSFPGDLFP